MKENGEYTTMDNVFLLDYYRMTGEKFKICPISLAKCLVSHQIMYMFWWRKPRLSVIRKVMLHKYKKRYGLEISPDAIIGKGLYLGHPYNITVGAGVILGNNVNLHKGCTIGRENRGKRAGTPTIGNQVSVGINSTVIGNIRIGDDVMIAPNSFVNFDVPDHSVVVGNPGEIHHKENATDGYIAYKI